MVSRLKVLVFMLLLAVFLSACNSDDSSSNREDAVSDQLTVEVIADMNDSEIDEDEVDRRVQVLKEIE